MLSFIDGYKSYITGGVMIIIGVVELIGIDVIPTVTQADAFNYILAGFSLISVKSAIAKSGTGS